MTDVLLSERRGRHVRVLTLNRPDALNAMNAELCQALHEAVNDLRGDRSCRAVVLTGAGRGFCAGVDLRGYGVAPGTDGSDEARDALARQEHMSRLILALRETPQPVIAAVNGPAAGFGLGLALGSDIRFAARSAVFRVAFLNMGLSNCDMASSWLLARLIGAARAHELMLTMRRMDAEEAERVGLVAATVEDGAVVERALEAADQIAALSPWGVRLTKQGMWTALEIASERACVEYEDRQQIMAIRSPAVAEAVTAFLEKRPANFAD
jgi:enoyl-CoA hydratase